jgi:salicylate biosynthesis isochorismate synthase
VLIPAPALAELGAALRRRRAGVRGARVAAPPDPMDLVRAGAGAFAAAAYYAAPGGRAVGGLGSAWARAASGWQRFSALDAALGEVLPEGVEALVGFAFSPEGAAAEEWEGFPSAVAMLPQLAVTRDRSGSRLRLAIPAGASPETVLTAAATLRSPGPPTAPAVSGDPRAVPSVAMWVRGVEETTAAIRGGRLSKVVLARTLEVTLDRAADPFDLVALLGSRCPHCHRYGWQAGPAAFVGATPELLVSRAGEWFEARPLAGSARRGADPDEDRRLGEGLLASAKDRAEHAFAADEVTAALRPLALTLERPPGPRLERLPGVQHLATPIRGTTEARLLQLVAALHPTPAVGGVPRGPALAHLARLEGFDRGWFAGGVGWADGAGNGEVAVALRCARMRGGEATLYAGAGIVAGSDAAAEAAETDLKMGLVLGLFG